MGPETRPENRPFFGLLSAQKGPLLAGAKLSIQGLPVVDYLVLGKVDGRHGLGLLEVDEVEKMKEPVYTIEVVGVKLLLQELDKQDRSALAGVGVVQRTEL